METDMNIPLTTTLANLREHGLSGEQLAESLGGDVSYGSNEPIPLLHILQERGLHYALWALRAVPDSVAFSLLLACDYAAHALPLFEQSFPGDFRVRDCITIARWYARGEATAEELQAAHLDALWVARHLTKTSSTAQYAAFSSAECAVWTAECAAYSAALHVAWAANCAKNAAMWSAKCADGGRAWQETHLRRCIEAWKSGKP